MKKGIITLGILCAFLTGISMASLMKKEKVIFVHKECDEGKCISYEDLYMIEEGLDDIQHYVNQMGVKNTWADRIVQRTNEINQIVK